MSFLELKILIRLIFPATTLAGQPQRIDFFIINKK